MFRLIHWLSEAITFVAAAIAIAMTMVIMTSVVMRYAAGAPLRFSEELIGIAFAGIVFAMLPACEANGQHIRITLLTDRYSERGKKIASMLDRLLMALFCLAFAYLSYDFTHTSYLWDVHTEFAGLVMWPWMAIMPLSCILTVLISLFMVRRRAGTWQEVDEDTEIMLIEEGEERK